MISIQVKSLTSAIENILQIGRVEQIGENGELGIDVRHHVKEIGRAQLTLQLQRSLCYYSRYCRFFELAMALFPLSTTFATVPKLAAAATASFSSLLLLAAVLPSVSSVATRIKISEIKISTDSTEALLATPFASLAPPAFASLATFTALAAFG